MIGSATQAMRIRLRNLSLTKIFPENSATII